MSTWNVKTSGTKLSGASTAGDWSDANCYASISAALSAAQTASDTTPSIVLNDETHAVGTAITGSVWARTVSITSRSDNADLCTVDCPSASIIPFTCNPTTGAGSLTLGKFLFTRSVTQTASAQLVLLSQLMEDLTLAGTHMGGFDASFASASTAGVLIRSATATARTITFTDEATFRDMTCTGPDLVLVTGANGGDEWRFESFRAARLSKTCSQDAHGYCYITRGVVYLGDVDLEDITAVQTDGSASNYAFFLHPSTAAAEALTVAGPVRARRLTWSGGSSGPTLLHTTSAYDITDVEAEDFTSTVSGETNSTGGLILLQNDTCQGTISHISATRGSSSYGPLVYWSNGAGGTAHHLRADDCECWHGTIYKGGAGSVTLRDFLVSGSQAKSGRPTSLQVGGMGVYAHNNGASNCTIEIQQGTVIGCAGASSGYPQAIQLRVLSTGNADVAIRNVICSNDTGTDDEIAVEVTGAGTLTVTTYDCYVDGGTDKIGAGITNTRLKTSDTAPIDAAGAIVAGSVAVYAGAQLAGLTTDLAGNAWRHPPSIGAFEFTGRTLQTELFSDLDRCFLAGRDFDEWVYFAGTPIRAIVLDDFEDGRDARAPQLFVKAEDMANYSAGAVVTIGASTYAAAGYYPDGAGGAIIQLQP